MGLGEAQETRRVRQLVGALLQGVHAEPGLWSSLQLRAQGSFHPSMQSGQKDSGLPKGMRKTQHNKAKIKDATWSTVNIQINY